MLRWQAGALFAWATLTAMVALEIGAPMLPTTALTVGFVLIYGTLVGVTSWLAQKVQRQAATGDAVLVGAAESWNTQLRERDVLARTGGDEFIAILPGADAAEAAHIADRLVRALTGPVACSIGVATWDGEHDLDQLLQTADRALYAAKRRLEDAGPGC